MTAKESQICKIALQREFPVGATVHSDHLRYMCKRNEGELVLPNARKKASLYRLQNCRDCATVKFPWYNGWIVIEPITDSHNVNGQYWEIIHSEWGRS